MRGVLVVGAIAACTSTTPSGAKPTFDGVAMMPFLDTGTNTATGSFTRSGTASVGDFAAM